MLLLSYIFEQFTLRIFNFLYRWYIGSFLNLYHLGISLLEYLDRSIAIKISAKHLFVPMYGDKTISGYLLGFIFRVLRIAVGLIIYTAIILIASAIYIIWAALPILIIIWGFFS